MRLYMTVKRSVHHMVAALLTEYKLKLTVQHGLNNLCVGRRLEGDEKWCRVGDIDSVRPTGRKLSLEGPIMAYHD